ncbi:MAG TPA: STAS domain-containing protein, partial [Bacteroidia bacterium]
LHALEEVFHYAKNNGMTLVLSGVQPLVLDELKRSGLYDSFGKENVTSVIDAALARAKEILQQ